VDVVQVRYAAPDREDLAYTGRMAEEARTPSGAAAFLGLVRALGRGAAEEARARDARLVHAHWWIPSGWAAMRVRLPTVLTLHGTDVRLLRGPARLLGRRVLGGAARVTAVSSHLAHAVRRLTWRPSLPIDLTPLPVETERFTGHSAGGGGIAVLGRLTEQKRVDLVLRAVQQRAIDVAVTIIGDGPARPGLERLANELGLHRVRFVGSVPPADVPAALGHADVLAFPALHEGLGLAAAEALMLGVPVVTTTDAGGVLDIVTDGPAGRIVPPTPAALGAALQALLDAPEARAAARIAGQGLRARLGAAGVAARFEEIYASCA
jgi:glycosyltransferase involved in cell wall biosynthesis